MSRYGAHGFDDDHDDREAEDDPDRDFLTEGELSFPEDADRN